MSDERDQRAEGDPERTQARGAEVLDVARGAASGAASTLRSGLSAVRDVRAAARRHSSARGRLL